MKMVRLDGLTVYEIIPDYALPVELWYGPEFATQCLEAPDDVEQGWTYDQDAGTFASPVEPEPAPRGPTPQDDADALLIDHEYRLTLLELGVGGEV